MNTQNFFDVERIVRYLRELERRVTRLEEEMDRKVEERPQA